MSANAKLGSASEAEMLRDDSALADFARSECLRVYGFDPVGGEAVEKNCGTGAGGVQPGNTCAGGGAIQDDAYAGLRPKVAEKLRDVEGSIRGNSMESAHVFSALGEELFSENGGSKSVSFSRDQIARLEGHPGSVLTHNHPRGGSFSLEDVKLAYLTRLGMIRAVGPDGTSYQIGPSRASGWMPYSTGYLTDQWDLSREAADAVVRPLLMPRVNEWETTGGKSGLDPHEAGRIHTHWQVRRFAKKTGLDYRMVLGKGVTREEISDAAA